MNSKQKQKHAKDAIKTAADIIKQKQEQNINRERFEREWKLKIKGDSLANYEAAIISQTLAKVMSKPKDFVIASKQLSQQLQYLLGKQHWNVIIVMGDYSRKTFASGQNYILYQRLDGLQVIIWLNMLSYHNPYQKSIVQQSEYF